MNDVPLVSVIIPVYNAEKSVLETINSALNQTLQEIEVIAVNDGSLDNSLEILKSIQSEKLIIVNQNNQGASAAKQHGLAYSHGKYLQYLDADDLLAPNKLLTQVDSLEKAPGKIALCKTAHFFGDDYLNDNIPDGDFHHKQYLDEPLKFLINLYGGYNLIGGMVQPNAFLTPMDIIQKAGPWNTALSPSRDEDGEYFARVILKSKGIIYDPTVMNYYRKFNNKNSLSGLSNSVVFDNLIESTWLKHLLLKANNTSPENDKPIDNAIYRQLEEIKVQLFPSFKPQVDKILAYQKSLNPSLRPKNDKLGGAIINSLSDIFGWKFARYIQAFKQTLLHKTSSMSK